MTTTHYPASQRGYVDYGWLDSHHSFSFGNWHDRERVQFGALRVLNDDVIKEGKGYDTQKVANMEIISIPLKGAVSHTDSIGDSGIVYTDDVQLMSAGSGVSLTEVNASNYDPINFLQIWIFPKQLNIAPRRQQRTFDPAQRIDQWQVLVSPFLQEGGLWINQEARLSITRLNPGKELTYTPVFPGNGVYIFMLEGSAIVNGQVLHSRDGLGITPSSLDELLKPGDTGALSVEANVQSDILVIEVPMFA